MDWLVVLTRVARKRKEKKEGKDRERGGERPAVRLPLLRSFSVVSSVFLEENHFVLSQKKPFCFLLSFRFVPKEVYFGHSSFVFSSLFYSLETGERSASFFYYISYFLLSSSLILFSCKKIYYVFTQKKVFFLRLLFCTSFVHGVETGERK